MRKVVLTEFLSADGVIESPGDWSAQYGTDAEGQFKRDELFASGALLLGRVTYQEFAGYWPNETDGGEFADKMNSLPKYVVSTTLQQADWNNSHIISADVAEAISKLKQEDGDYILIYGSAKLAQSLLQMGLIDEYRLMLFPIVVGKGKRLFAEEGNRQALKLVDTKMLGNGVLVLTYEPAEAEAKAEDTAVFDDSSLTD